MIIRKYKNIDYIQIIDLWKKLKLPYKPLGRDSKEELNRQNNLNCSYYLVVELNLKIIGSIFATHDGRKGWINRLAVSINFQRKGVAKKLISKAENYFLKNNIKIYACLIEGNNASSKKTFENSNYKEFKNIYYYTKRIKNNI